MFRYPLFSILILIIVLAVSNFDVIQYGIGQAKGQWKVLHNSRSLDEVLKDKQYPDSLKQKIELVKEIRLFAIETIGLKNSNNYTTFYDQEGKVILWNLSACEPYQFKPKTWSFPILGAFPYKGFFELEKAKGEKIELEKLGYDTRIRPVGGWSTLGWFSDPILSNMLDRSNGRLAELIIHELTHATLFVKDDIVFNENLASFIGEIGAVSFLKEKYGHASPELEGYQKQKEDDRKFTRQMLLGYQLLDSLYRSMEDQVQDSLKYAKKDMLIDKISSSLDTISFHDQRYYQVFKKRRPNNAYFMSFQRYHSAEDSLARILVEDYEDHLTNFIQGMKAYHE